jgi:hypothetical protein
MKIYHLRFKTNRLTEFIKFCIIYNVSIYFTWSEETFLGDTMFFATVSTIPDSKITSEEKERLLNESWGQNTIKTEAI